MKNAEIRNDDPFNGDEYENSPKPEKDSLKVPYNLALNQYDKSSYSNYHETNMTLDFVIFRIQTRSALSSLRGHQLPSSLFQAVRSSRTVQSLMRISRMFVIFGTVRLRLSTDHATVNLQRSQPPGRVRTRARARTARTARLPTPAPTEHSIMQSPRTGFGWW